MDRVSVATANGYGHTLPATALLQRRLKEYQKPKCTDPEKCDMPQKLQKLTALEVAGDGSSMKEVPAIAAPIR